MTSPNLPGPPRIDRSSLERIIQRAAELQSADRELGEHLSHDEVVALGNEVGIPARYLRQAMLEYQGRSTQDRDRSLADRFLGPADIVVERVVQGDAAELLQRLVTWMERHELLVIQRRQPGWVSWEPLRGMQAAIRRGTAAFDTSKPKFMLSRVEVITATVTGLEGGFCHVSLRATLSGVRAQYVGAAVATAGFGALATAGLTIFGALYGVAFVPVALGALLGIGLLRRFEPISRRVELGLQRALDWADRSGVTGEESGGRLFDAIAGEVKRALSGRREQPPKDQKR